MRVAVVGAGVGGLTVAAALQGRGVDVTVFEQASELREQGTGLTLWTNAVAALREMGLAQPLNGIAEPVERMVFLSSSGECLNEAQLERGTGRLSEPTVNVHRGELLRVLAGLLDEDAIVFGARYAGFEQDGSGITVRFADGTEHRADLLVAADGAGSQVRRAIHGEEDRRRGRRWSGWQGVAPSRPAGLPVRAVCAVLSGRAVAGLYPLADGRVHWFLDDHAPRGTKTVGTLLARLGNWPPVVREAIAATTPESVSYNEVRDRRPLRGRWGVGRVTLLGDAAHPMLPTLGQGACQAIEDAATLVRCLGAEAGVEAALRDYEWLRSRRAASFVRASCRAAAARSGAPERLRDALLGKMPPPLLSSLFRRCIRPAEA